jgi:hypothetical protein
MKERFEMTGARLSISDHRHARAARSWALAGIFLIADCAGNHVSVGSGPSNGQAVVVVVGAAITKQETFLGVPTTQYLMLEWQEYDRTTETLNPNGKIFSVMRNWRGCNVGIGGDACDPRNVTYDAQSVPAGDYVLKSISTRGGAGNMTHTTSFLPLQGGVFKSVPLVASIKGAKAPRYHFEPDEVAYLGDFTIDVLKFPPQLVSLRWDEVAAKAALAVYPEIRDRLAFRGPENIVTAAARTDRSELELQGTAVGGVTAQEPK